MTPIEYLDAAKKTIGITSDYELAKRLEVSRQAMSDYRNGKRSPDAYVVFKLAITLNLDPAMVLADLESQKETNEKKRGFWSSFMQRAAIVAVLVCTLALNFSGIAGNERARLGGLFRRFQFA